MLGTKRRRPRRTSSAALITLVATHMLNVHPVTFSLRFVLGLTGVESRISPGAMSFYTYSSARVYQSTESTVAAAAAVAYLDFFLLFFYQSLLVLFLNPSRKVSG